MIVFTIVTFIVAIALPSISGPFTSSNNVEDKGIIKISPILFSRLAAIAFLYSAFLSYNVLYIDILTDKVGIFSGLFTVSSFSLSMEIFIYTTASLILVGWFIKPLNTKSYTNNISGPVVSEYPLMLMFTLLGASLLISSADLMSMYLSIELQSFSVYMLAALYKDNELATAAGLKYFLLGGLSSCFILFGAALIYSLTGLTNIENIFNLLFSITTSPEILNSIKEGFSLFSLSTDVNIHSTAIVGVVGILFITVGFLFKIAAAPFHFWAPDVYDEVPTSVTMWLTIIPKLSIVIFLLQLISLSLLSSGADGIVNIWAVSLKNIFIISSLLSLIIGGLVGLAQYKVKRLLAYSTISHVGFLLLALGINSESSIESLLFYLVQYSITSLNTFLIILAIGYFVKQSVISNQSNFGSVPTDINYISELKGQFIYNPLLTLSLAISLFSMAGVPPLLGFFAKQQVLYAALENGYYFMSVIAILLSVVSASYYLQIIKIMHFSSSSSLLPISLKSNEISESDSLVSNVHSMTISVLTLSILLFILNPTIFLDSTQLLSTLLFNS